MKLTKLVLLACALPFAANAKVIWRGDFETGNLTQYSQTEMVSSDRLAVVTNPVEQGHYALKATVVQGDNPNHASGNRNELVETTYDPEGSDYYYSWSTMFPSSYLNVATWQVFAQWHQNTCCGSPPVLFDTNGGDIRLYLGAHDGSDGAVVWTTPLVRNQWLKFTAHIHWSTDASKGFIELYYNGKLVLPKTHGYTGAGTYFKQGLYRNATITQTEYVYHDGMTKADTLADVESGSTTGTGGTSSGGGSTVSPTPVSSDGGTADAPPSTGDDSAPTASPASSNANGTPAANGAPAVNGNDANAVDGGVGCSAATGSNCAGMGLVLALGMLALRRRARLARAEVSPRVRR